MSKSFIQKVSIVIAVLLLLLLQYRIWFDDSGVLASRALQQDISMMQQGNNEVKTQNQDLTNDISSLSEDGYLIEETAREELGLIKPDETFILILDKDR